MRVKRPLVMCNDKGDEETVTDVITLHKNKQRIEHLGLTLAEATHLLSTLQRPLLQQHVNTFLDTCSDGPDCGTPLPLQARSRRSLRTVCGTWKFDSPRLGHGDCPRRKTSSLRPLAARLTESLAPELLSMEAKWSSLVSYGMSRDALQDFLPRALTLDGKTGRYDTRKVAKRLEAELGDEQAGFIEGDASDGDLVPLPEGSLQVGIAGGYVRNWVDKKRTFEVMGGKSPLSFGEGEEAKTPWHKRCGFVQTDDDAKPKRRLPEVLHAQGVQMNQEVTFLSDGHDTLRALQLEMSPKATHILDWLHLTMQRTVLGQYGTGLGPCEAELGEQIGDQSERLQWSLWPGQVDKALGKIDDVESAIEPCSQTYARFPQLGKAWSALRPYIGNNRPLLPNYGER